MRPRPPLGPGGAGRPPQCHQPERLRLGGGFQAACRHADWLARCNALAQDWGEWGPLLPHLWYSAGPDAIAAEATARTTDASCTLRTVWSLAEIKPRLAFFQLDCPGEAFSIPPRPEPKRKDPPPVKAAAHG
ncbi:MAG: hypothetical protein ACK5AZ_10040 [Bryobacteraceae bacterium]